jgi:predicted GIY-YIG superfamily endonuclease
MAWVYILRGKSGRHYFGASDHLGQRINEHERGSCHTTWRLGARLELVGFRQVFSMQEARALEKRLKKMKNPAKLFAFCGASEPNESSSPDSAWVGSGFESRPTQLNRALQFKKTAVIERHYRIGSRSRSEFSFRFS